MSEYYFYPKPLNMPTINIKKLSFYNNIQMLQTTITHLDEFLLLIYSALLN